MSCLSVGVETQLTRSWRKTYTSFTLDSAADGDEDDAAPVIELVPVITNQTGDSGIHRGGWNFAHRNLHEVYARPPFVYALVFCFLSDYDNNNNRPKVNTFNLTQIEIANGGQMTS